MKNKYISISLAVAILLLLLLVVSFIRDIRRLYTNGVIVYPGSMRNFYRMNRRPATLSDVNLIAGWMTFNYINKAFILPPDYLKTTLQISIASYPNITISKISAQLGLQTTVYLEKVKSAVSVYLLQNTSPQ